MDIPILSPSPHTKPVHSSLSSTKAFTAQNFPKSDHVLSTLIKSGNDEFKERKELIFHGENKVEPKTQPLHPLFEQLKEQLFYVINIHSVWWFPVYFLPSPLHQSCPEYSSSNSHTFCLLVPNLFPTKFPSPVPSRTQFPSFPSSNIFHLIYCASRFIQGKHVLWLRHVKWVENLQQFSVIIKHMFDVRNNYVEAYFWWNVLLSILRAKIIGFDCLKESYYDLELCAKEAHFENGLSFKGTRLFVPKHSLKELLISEPCHSSSAELFVVEKDLALKKEIFCWSKLEKENIHSLRTNSKEEGEDDVYLDPTSHDSWVSYIIAYYSVVPHPRNSVFKTNVAHYPAVPYKFSWVREISQLYTWTFVLNMQRSILSSLMRQQTQWFQPGSCPVPSSSSMFASPVPSQFSKAVNPVPNGPRNVRELFSGVPSILNVPNISSCPAPSDYCAVPIKSSKAASPVPHDARIIVDFRNLLNWTQNHNWINLINLSMIIDKGVSSSCPVPSSSSSVVSSVPQLVSSVPQQSSSVNSPVPHIAKCITVV